jgi:RHS repeat-associated protein
MDSASPGLGSNGGKPLGLQGAALGASPKMAFGNDSQEIAQRSAFGMGKSNESSLPAVPSISLPKGGGAINSMGEKFNANLNTGTGSVSFPVQVSPGRAGMQPQLSLSYDSGAGNSEFGLGWNLSGPGAISRKTSKGLPLYDNAEGNADSDVFLLSSAEDLVPLFKRDSQGNIVKDTRGRPVFEESSTDGYTVRRYHSRIVQSFSRIERWTNAVKVDDVHWRVISAQNLTTIYGNSESSRIYDPNTAPDQPLRIFSWLVAESYDVRGNAMIFNYRAENSDKVPTDRANEANRSELTRKANRYLKNIRYGNTAPNRESESWVPFSAFQLAEDTWQFSVVFDYGEYNLDTPTLEATQLWDCRLDPFSNYHSCFEVRTYRLCRRILMFHHFTELQTKDYLVASTDLTYHRNSAATYLTSAIRAGYVLEGTREAYTRRTFPPLTFEYSLFPTDEELQELNIQEVGKDSVENMPLGLDGINYQWVDLDGEGLSGILAEQGDSWYYKRNTSANNLRNFGANGSNGEDSKKAEARFEPLEAISLRPNVSLAAGARFGDVQGDGKLDVIQASRSHWGYFERRSDQHGWEPFQAFKTFPNINITDPNVKFVDITGDGLADILVYADQVYWWYPSLLSKGYGPGQSVLQPFSKDEGPTRVYSDREEIMYLADMSGDGLVDLVRITDCDVCYWPNCGYGHFGAIIKMDNPPQFDHCDVFSERRIRLADIDGSGATDILYFGSKGVDFYLNQAGNSFAAKRSLTSFPPIDDTASLHTIDLLGSGTICAVWSSFLPGAAGAPLRYVDFMRGKKPHLLVGMSNNLGSELQIHYAPSTRFYLQDKDDGSPWITRLPFPVHCVERTDTIDHIGNNRFVKKYSYHHGYFDGMEREFRGFARADEWDTEEFEAVTHHDPAANEDSSWHVPPVHTKTWFHTGAFIEGDQISRQLAREYFGAPLRGDGRAMGSFYDDLLPDTVITSTELEIDVLAEAYRALKGRTLRTEVYAEDGSALAGIPYSVQESNFTVETLQPLQDAHFHSIHTVNTRENISYHYERNIDDPRIEHEMTLQVDGFGNELKSINIAYGRRPGRSPLTGPDKAKQETTLFVYSEQNVTNVTSTANNYRAPVVYEGRQYEVTGFRLSPGATRFQLADFTAQRFESLNSLTEIPFEQKNDPNAKQKRLIRRSRTLFRRDDLSGLLPAGQVQASAIPGAEYELCFTPGLISSVFKRRSANQPDEDLIPDPPALLGGIGDQNGGYVDLDGDGAWWKTGGRVSFHLDPTAPAAQELAEARGHFFAPRSFADPFGNIKSVDYDPYSLFPLSFRDPAGNVVSTLLDYRVLTAHSVTDPNGNRTAVAFDALGFAVGTAVMGENASDSGDSLENFKSNLTQTEIDEFFSNPRGSPAASLLGKATTRIIHDVTRYWRDTTKKTPSYSAIVARENHVNDEPSRGAKLQVGFAYSDGFSRIVQEKLQAKPGPVVEDGPEILNRWTGQGWTVYNNKNKPVRQYEPFFDDAHDFKYAAKVGVSPIIMYDPLVRPVATIHPDHTLEKVVVGPWSQMAYDANDNVLLSDPKSDPAIGHYFDPLPTGKYMPSWYEQRISGRLGTNEREAAVKAAAHANTPSIVHMDALARVILAIKDNGNGELLMERVTLDIQGNPLEFFDAQERMMMHYDVDMCSTSIHLSGMDSGERWELNDVSGDAFVSWNSRGFRFWSSHDALRRRTESWVRDGNGPEILLTQISYGEVAPDAVMHNLKGKPWQIRDQAGLLSHEDYDFKGNLLRGSRKLAENFKETLDWSLGVTLQNKSYTSSTVFDALDRELDQVLDDRSIIRRIYGDNARLDKILVNIRGEQGPDPSSWSSFVTSVDHNARNQEIRVEYANGSFSLHKYDSVSFRLQQMQTLRAPQRPGGFQTELQNLSYTYDPIGNITHIRDDAQQSVFFRGRRVDPSNDYTYDSVYRLIEAKGREHLGQTNGQPSSPTEPGAWDTAHGNPDHPGNGDAMGTYVETYSYDSAGNILSMAHRTTDPAYPGWRRDYAYNEASQLEPGVMNNRLSSTSVRNTTENYSYAGSAGIHGIITGMPHLSSMQFDFLDQLRSTSKQNVREAATPETTYYVYDWTGQRIRKVTESHAGTPGSTPTPKLLNERLYLGDLEIYHKFGGSEADPVDNIALERATLHVPGSRGELLALVETRTRGAEPNLPRQTTRYQLANHLGSACLEVDESAAIISYEEYFPFGATSYHAVTAGLEVPEKRYRYVGKERDSSTGFYFHGARYYAPWIGRWTAPDPSFLTDGPNMYEFAHNNPARYVDLSGQEAPDWLKAIWEKGMSVQRGVAQQIGKNGTVLIQEVIVEVDEFGNTVKRLDIVTKKLSIQVKYHKLERYIEDGVLQVEKYRPELRRMILRDINDAKREVEAIAKHAMQDTWKNRRMLEELGLKEGEKVREMLMYGLDEGKEVIKDFRKLAQGISKEVGGPAVGAVKEAGKLSKFARFAGPIIGAIGVGFAVHEAITAPDMEHKIIAGLDIVGGVLMMIPTPLTVGIGLGLSVVGAGARMAVDHMQEQQQKNTPTIEPGPEPAPTTAPAPEPESAPAPVDQPKPQPKPPSKKQPKAQPKPVENKSDDAPAVPVNPGPTDSFGRPLVA